MTRLLFSVFLLLNIIGGVSAAPSPYFHPQDHSYHGPVVRHHHTQFSSRHHSYQHVVRENAVGPVTWVDTAAGKIQVAESLAPQFQGFIKDLVDDGYTPRHIGCFASHGHVSHSRHYVGAACDFDQTGWGRTVSHMYHVSALAHKWGLRDGCSFGDCGHIDDGKIGAQYVERHKHSHYGG